MTWVPTGRELLFHPRRNNWFGAPISTFQPTDFPSASLTSMYTQECGLIHSIFVTDPFKVTGLLASNSAENAWCAASGAPSPGAPIHVAATTANILRMQCLLSGS